MKIAKRSTWTADLAAANPQYGDANGWHELLLYHALWLLLWPVLSWSPLFDNSLAAFLPGQRSSATRLCIGCVAGGMMLYGAALVLVLQMAYLCIIGQSYAFQQSSLLLLGLPYVFGFVMSKRLHYAIGQATSSP